MFDYIDFIKRLINIANIMDKKFYIVIPYMPPPKMGPNLPSASKNQNQGPIITLNELNKYKQELKQRIQVVQNSLSTVGIRSAQLNTQQIIELLYGIYNPSEATKEKLTQVEHLTSQIVEGESEKPTSPSGGS